MFAAPHLHKTPLSVYLQAVLLARAASALAVLGHDSLLCIYSLDSLSHAI